VSVTTTRPEKLACTRTTDGTNTNDETGTDVIVEAGTDKTTDDGTDDGTLVDSTMASPLVDKMMTWSDGSDETADDGTTTMLLDAQADGIVTEAGTVIYETADDGTEKTIDDGTFDGTADHSTITADGDEPIGIKADDGSDETHETGTTTGDAKLDGTTTDDGTNTYELVATDVTADDGIVKATDDGTDDGTFDQATTANPEVDKTIT
jgi:hypothetical protein